MTPRRVLGRRRPRREGPSRGLYLLPSLFTTGNLFFGFFAIVQATMGNPDRAAMGIVLAGVCDALDGRLARLARTTSRFGLQYDSIADTVSFGVAPAMLAFSAGNLEVLGRVGWVMAFLYMVCAALRLARFNVTEPRYAGRFEGLPSPAAAGMIAATQWFISFVRDRGMPAFSVPEPVVAAGTAALALLMVSAIPYRSFKEIDLRHSYGTLVVVVFAIAVIIAEPSLSLFGIGLVYVSSGPVELGLRWFYKRPLVKAVQALSGEPPGGPTP